MDRKSAALIIGGTGKTGRRVSDRLLELGHKVRIASRVGEHPFVWEDQATWEPALEGVDVVYIAHHDITQADAGAQIGRFSKVALDRGVRRQVLLSGRADEQFNASVESDIRGGDADWIILRPSWFMQNFSEMFFLGAVLAGEIALPVGDATEPFIDIEDVAAVAVAGVVAGACSGEGAGADCRARLPLKRKRSSGMRRIRK